MKKLIIPIIVIGSVLQGCQVCCSSKPKHYNARNLSDRK